jgi:glycerate kinase
VLALGDVTNPLLGRRGAAAVFGPQKGAAQALVPILESRLARFADQVTAANPAARPEQPGAGAAGGTGFALMAWGATLTSGSSAIGEALDLEQACAESDVVITGEGSFDEQSLHGKVTAHVATLARLHGAAPYLVAGRIGLGGASLFDGEQELVALAGTAQESLAHPEDHLITAGAWLADRFSTA